MSKLSNFIKDVILPEDVDKERRNKILEDGIITTWKNHERERKLKEAKELAKGTNKKARLSADKNPKINET